jgi:hypothetical protein
LGRTPRLELVAHLAAERPDLELTGNPDRIDAQLLPPEWFVTRAVELAMMDR